VTSSSTRGVPRHSKQDGVRGRSMDVIQIFTIIEGKFPKAGALRPRAPPSIRPCHQLLHRFIPCSINKCYLRRIYSLSPKICIFFDQLKLNSPEIFSRKRHVLPEL